MIADNAGFDSSDLVAQLRAAHTEGQSTMGLDMDLGEIADVKQLGITESFKVKSQVRDQSWFPFLGFSFLFVRERT